MKKLYLSFLLLALPLLVSAYDAEVDGIYYNLNSQEKTAEVTYQKDYGGNSPYYKSYYSGSVNILEKFTFEGIEYSVTSIGDYAFYKCTGLTSVTIPNSVTSIGISAFVNCSGLTSVTIPNYVTTISHLAFSGCSSLTSVTIPNSVTTIGGDAFSNCSSLISVTIPNSVTSIEGATFYNCSSLTSVTIPNSVTTIGEVAFAYCSSLTSVTIPNTVTSIGKSAFYNCSSLTSVTIGSSVRSIYDLAFANSSKLEEVYCLAELVPNTYTYVFGNYNITNATLYVPASALNDYKSTEPWCLFGTILPIGSNEYKLTYEVDGETYITYTVKRGNIINPEAPPTKEGYTFSGWSEIPETMPASDVTITGSFTINKYKLTYTLDGEEYKTAEVDYGTTLTPEEAPVKEGYTFSGWSEIPETMPANDVTVTGTFTINKYKLTYKVDGEEYKASEVDYGTAITAEAVPTKDGYTFSGWSEIPETMPASDVTITGSFTVNKYNLTYKVDGVDYITTQIEFGSAINPEAIPTKEGYTFSGWSDIPESMPANDVTVTGTFTINKYKLTYMVDGEEYKSSEVDYGTAITAEAIPVKEGYTFSGWSVIPATMPAGDVTITGSFSVNKYNLTYKVDGVDYKTAQIEFGSPITSEAIPTKEGYTFSGWSDIPESMPANDVTVTGTFTINKYKLTYMVDGAEYKSSEVDFGTAITAEAIPTKEGYTFSGWSEIPSTMPASDVTITGTFTINKYKLTYTVDGKVFKSSEVDFGSAITAEAIPTKEGYTFSGWSEIPSTMPASDVTITGSFSANKYKLTYTIDGKEYKTTELDYGTALTPEEAPVKEGYTFSGWSDIPTTMPANNVTITGSFTVNKYKLTYMVDGVEYKSYEVEFGATITPEASPANEGQMFSGWSEIPATMPANDVVITGTFSDNSYKLTYMVDGEVFKSSHVEYGSTITPETPPTKEGYTFSGWSEIPETMPAGDVTITGTFTINTYTITYMVDNALLMTEEVTYGSTITPPASPKEGYEITWNSHPTTMPAYDVTIYGSYIATGINGIYAEEPDKQVYTPDGKRIQSPKKGMNIIRMSDGTIKKVVVK